MSDFDELSPFAELLNEVADLDGLFLAEFWMERAEAAGKCLVKAINRYTELVNSGDCGFWDPEKEPWLVEARAVLSQADLLHNIEPTSLPLTPEASTPVEQARRLDGQPAAARTPPTAAGTNSEAQP